MVRYRYNITVLGFHAVRKSNNKQKAGLPALRNFYDTQIINVYTFAKEMRMNFVIVNYISSKRQILLSLYVFSSIKIWAA